MTFVSVIVAVLGTLLGVLMIWLGLRIGRWAGRKWKARKEGWWRWNNLKPKWIYRYKGRKHASTETEPAESAANGVANSSETTPLLA